MSHAKRYTYIVGYEWHMYTINSDPKRNAYRVWL